MEWKKFSIVKRYEAILEKDGKNYRLNDNDLKLLLICLDENMWMTSIAAKLGINVKNISSRVERLIEFGLIKVEGIFGTNRKYVKTIVDLSEFTSFMQNPSKSKLNLQRESQGLLTKPQ